MNELPQPPAGSVIEVEQDFDGLVYRWQQPEPILFYRVLIIVLYVLVLCWWAYGTITPLRHFWPNAPWFIMVWLAFSFAAGATIIRMLWLLLTQKRPESVTLDAAMLHYNPGSPPTRELTEPWHSFMHSSPYDIFQRLWLKPRVQAIFKRKISAIKLKETSKRQRLVLDVGAKRVEIGKYLAEPEREWLAEELRAWHSAGVDTEE